MVAYSFQRRFVDPIKVGLGLAVVPPEYTTGPVMVPAPKRQTIRAHGKRRHARPGETLQLYTAMRTKQCFKIGEARCTAVNQITMMVGRRTIAFLVDGEPIPDHREFVMADGFENLEDMLAFWHSEHRGVDKFEGVIIKWEPLA